MIHSNIVKGSSVVQEEGMLSDLAWVTPVLQKMLMSGKVLRIQEVEIVPEKPVPGYEYTDVGFIPSGYNSCIKPDDSSMTNHEVMGSDRFVTINGEVYSAAWFRLATAEEVNQQARRAL